MTKYHRYENKGKDNNENKKCNHSNQMPSKVTQATDKEAIMSLSNIPYLSNLHNENFYLQGKILPLALNDLIIRPTNNLIQKPIEATANRGSSIDGRIQEDKLYISISMHLLKQQL